MQNLDSKGVTGRSRRFQLFVERASHAVFLQLRENFSRGSESRWIMRLGCEIACKAGAEKISQAFGHDWRILARQVEAGGSPLFARKKRRMASARLGQVKGGATRQILRLFAYRIHCAPRGGITCKQLYGCLEVLAECPQSRHADAAGRLNSATRDNSILVAECRE